MNAFPPGEHFNEVECSDLICSVDVGTSLRMVNEQKHETKIYAHYIIMDNGYCVVLLGIVIG